MSTDDCGTYKVNKDLSTSLQ